MTLSMWAILYGQAHMPVQSIVSSSPTISRARSLFRSAHSVVAVIQVLPISRLHYQETNVTSSWYGVRAARVDKAEAEIETFLINLGALKGKKTSLPAFSAQHAVSAEEKAIFDKACGDYPMPLGTPSTVGTRSLDNATEYLFTCNSKDMQGKESKQLIYVIKGNAEGSVPEFTQVER